MRVTALVDQPVSTETVVPVRRPSKSRWALVALLGATAVLYLWRLSASGYGNTFYAAASQAGSQSWSAWFFGSVDPQNFITVDKPPASLWVSGLSVRLFGMHSWSVMAPQALMGVAAVAVLYSAVRRAFPDPNQGAAAGLLAGATLAATPAAALMFRFNNPDALLVLLLTVAAYCLTRATLTASWRWLTLVGAVMGIAFLTKMLQGFLVLPGFGVAYLLVAPTTWGKRALHLLGAAVALIVAAGWWVLAVQLTPASARPYIGGSTDNTVLDLALGYNGINRLLGHHPEGKPLGDWGSSSVPMLGGHTGAHRLFTGEMANEISWLFATALFVVALGTYLAARRALSRGELCALLTWGGWLLVTGVVFSFMGGMIHPYYTVALAPAVAALVSMGAVWAWQRRLLRDGRCALAALIVLSAAPSAFLLHRNAFGPGWLPLLIVAVAVVSAVGVLLPRPPVLALVAGCAAGLTGTVAFSIATAATPHHGTMPTAARTSQVSGSWINDEATNAQLAAMLASTHTQWSAATNGSQSAAALEIASGTSVMAVGGWSGDPVPTVQQFIDDVHAGKISYYVEAGRGPNSPGAHGEVIRSTQHTVSHTREISDWVAAHYPGTFIGGSTVYRLN
ncbi:PMT family glycosyltransferase, 4-amino-4-deoxy-L-arabinose transferase [Mycobacterium sp. JS623]|uniref:ArnT family glycosyltransferase n=1 Tax=Mycobacterium sp. JS623 TaxID=212767 RepID=UPI0002A56D92|nr:PMT family glycosyltransferase, 4-amino-4-deoxy-L-arabinose transferase [Mycobacterium sp. JS623]